VAREHDGWAQLASQGYSRPWRAAVRTLKRGRARAKGWETERECGRARPALGSPHRAVGNNRRNGGASQAWRPRPQHMSPSGQFPEQLAGDMVAEVGA
jgi:hypothetical protein